jgi:hypothetical protein
MDVYYKTFLLTVTNGEIKKANLSEDKRIITKIELDRGYILRDDLITNYTNKLVIARITLSDLNTSSRVVEYTFSSDNDTVLESCTLPIQVK